MTSTGLCVGVQSCRTHTDDFCCEQPARRVFVQSSRLCVTTLKLGDVTQATTKKLLLAAQLAQDGTCGRSIKTALISQAARPHVHVLCWCSCET